jgi:hypothetical protein
MSTASASICSSVKPGLRLMIFNNYALSPISMPNGSAAPGVSETYSISDSVSESYEFNPVICSFPMGINGENQPQGGGL